MRKLRLTLDSLEVETFQVAAPGDEPGTVRGNAWSDVPRYCKTDQPPGECFPSNVGCDTWEAACQPTNYEPTCEAESCAATCGITCLATCLRTCGYCTGESCGYICP